MYIPINEAAYIYDVPLSNLQKLYHKDKKRGLYGRFIEDESGVKVFAGSSISFPECEKVKELFEQTPYFFKYEKDMAKEIAKKRHKKTWSEYMNIRNFTFKNPKYAQIVLNCITEYMTTHPLLFSIDELERS
jgi:hypothetical protein